ncbi:hypothetical protein IG631_13514 [Alternaria alternata]|nr:hypothetical protein IG631_13514 [Alternaria alternata]
MDENAVWSMQALRRRCSRDACKLRCSWRSAPPRKAGGGEVLVDASHSVFSSPLNILHLARNSCAHRTKSPYNRHYGAIVAPPSCERKRERKV